ncbi:organic cation/carnitine transporter 2-like isoform X2 [Engraulis encrasicolus]
MVFVGDIPPHHCRVPFLNSSYGEQDYNLSIPTEELKGEIILSRCRRYTEKRDSYSAYSNDTEGCVDGWVFSKERYASTIVTEWSLVCDDAWKAPFPVTVFFFGSLAGSFGSGILSDRYGRKITFFSAKVLQILLGFLLAASTRWEMFCVLYCALGVMTTTTYCVCFALGSEILIKSARESFGILVAVLYGAGYTIPPVLAFFIRDWRILQTGLSLVVFIYIPLFWYIPESPRWLITQGRLQEAEAIIRAAAKRNGITPPEKIFQLEHSADTKATEHVEDSCKFTYLDPLKKGNDRISVITLPEDILQLELSSDTKGTKRGSSGRDKYTWLDLLKNQNMRNITFINILTWLTISLTYFGLSLDISNLDGDPCVNSLISAATEFVGCVFLWFSIHYAPRRFVLPFTLLLGGALQLFIQLVPNELSGLIITLVVTGRLVMIGAFGFVFVYSSELFPTVVRGMGLGVSSMAGGIGCALSPYVAHIGTYNKTLPFILMGTISLFSGGLSLLLPETKGEKLPELISQVKPLQGCCLKMKSGDGIRVNGHVE